MSKSNIEKLTLRAIRGAISSDENTSQSIENSVVELITNLTSKNNLSADSFLSIIFSTTTDLDACFPASIVRNTIGMKEVALLDCQQMFVDGDIKKCIRVLAHAWMPSHSKIYHPYLKKASTLRPDRIDI